MATLFALPTTKAYKKIYNEICQLNLTLINFAYLQHFEHKFPFNFSVSVFLSTLDKLVYRSVMHAGSCTVWNMVSSLMVRCQVTKPSEVVMIPSIHSSVRLEQANTFQELSLLIWNQLL